MSTVSSDAQSSRNPRSSGRPVSFGSEGIWYLSLPRRRRIPRFSNPSSEDRSVTVESVHQYPTRVERTLANLRRYTKDGSDTEVVEAFITFLVARIEDCHEIDSTRAFRVLHGLPIEALVGLIR